MTHTRTPQDFPLRATLQRLRREAGLTQKEAAERLGVSPVTVSGWEIGKRTPEPPMLPKIAALYGVTVDNLLGLSPPAETKPAETGPARPSRTGAPRGGEVAFVPVYRTVTLWEGSLAFLDFRGTYPVPVEDAEARRGVHPVLLRTPEDAPALAGIPAGVPVLVHVGDRVRAGDTCVVVLDGCREQIRICRGIRGNTLTLQAGPGASESEERDLANPRDIYVVGPCMAVYQPLSRAKFRLY